MTEATNGMLRKELAGIDTSDLTGPDRDFVEAILCVWGTRQPNLEQMYVPSISSGMPWAATTGRRMPTC